MADKEKLQKIFDAALRAEKESQVATAARSSAPQAAPPASQPDPPHARITNKDTAAGPATDIAAASPDAANAGLDDASVAELAALLDEQHKRKLRKRRREALAILAILLVLASSAFAWFAQSPYRVQAIRDAMRDIHSVGDIQGLVAKYRAALDKVSVRSTQVNRATEAMGVSSNQDGEKDVNFDKEMRDMMGAEGKTIGERNRLIQEKFGGGKPLLGKAPDPPGPGPDANAPGVKQ